MFSPRSNFRVFKSVRYSSLILELGPEGECGSRRLPLIIQAVGRVPVTHGEGRTGRHLTGAPGLNSSVRLVGL